jgi:excisionase family DNA binding protein
VTGVELDKFMSVERAAELMGVSRATVKEWCWRGLIPNFRPPGIRRVFIPCREFERWRNGDCELETRILAGGGRRVSVKKGKAGRRPSGLRKHYERSANERLRAKPSVVRPRVHGAVRPRSRAVDACRARAASAETATRRRRRPALRRRR